MVLVDTALLVPALLIPVITAVIFGLFRLLTLVIAIRGTAPGDREKIVLAVAQMFRWWRKPEG